MWSKCMHKNQDIIFDENLVTMCGLYCGACPRFLKNKCKGCREKDHFPSYCDIKPCAIEHNIDTCAQCPEYSDVRLCKTFNPFLIKVGEFITGTSRARGIDMIRTSGKTAFAQYMVDNRFVSIKGKKRK